jgi:type IV pilus assembly protein PilW
MKEKALLSNPGMTLIELLIAMAVGSIIMAAIYTVYISQVQGQATQEAALEMQQGLRAALSIMEREIRTAGADPSNAAGAGIITAEVDQFHFTHDITGGDDFGMDSFDGRTDGPNENIRYAINNAGHLGRDTGGGLQSVLENVDALNFVYLNRTGNVMAAPVTGLARNNIRKVQVTIVTRYGMSRRGMLRAHTDTTVYRNQQGDIILPAQNDTFRRLMMTTTITCRNMALGD